MKYTVQSSVSPLLLGFGKTAAQTAWHLFAEYGVFSTVLDRKRTFAAHFTPFSHFRLLPDVSDEFIVMSLEKYADEHSDKTCVIVPCNEYYGKFAKRNASRLERRFLLRSPDNACKITPQRHSTVKD